MYTTTVNVYMKNMLGTYGLTEPSVYKKESEGLFAARDIDDVIKQAIEIERIDNETLYVYLTIEDEDGYVDSDEFHVTTDIKRTTTPSKFVKWPEGKAPDIFAVDWSKSQYSLKP